MCACRRCKPSAGQKASAIYHTCNAVWLCHVNMCCLPKLVRRRDYRRDSSPCFEDPLWNTLVCSLQIPRRIRMMWGGYHRCSHIKWPNECICTPSLSTFREIPEIFPCSAKFSQRSTGHSLRKCSERCSEYRTARQYKRNMVWPDLYNKKSHILPPYMSDFRLTGCFASVSLIARCFVVSDLNETPVWLQTHQFHNHCALVLSWATEENLRELMCYAICRSCT